MKSEFEQYIKINELDVNPSDFRTFEKSFEYSLRFELGDELDNGTRERVDQATRRGLKIFYSCFDEDKELFVITYEWDEEIDFSARTPEFLYQILGVKRSSEMQKLALMNLPNEEPEYEDGYLGIYKLNKEKITWEKLLEGIANRDMGFNPSVHQIVFIFGVSSAKMFWMYDDRGCLIMTQDVIALETDFNTYKNWLSEGYKENYKEILEAPNNAHDEHTG